jgi:hypothetical protein
VELAPGSNPTMVELQRKRCKKITAPRVA